MDGWNTSFLLERPIFRGYVSFMECIFSIFYQHLLAFLHRHLWLNAGRATGLTGQVTSNGGLPRFTEREVGSAEQLMLSRMPEGCSWLQWRIYIFQSCRYTCDGLVWRPDHWWRTSFVSLRHMITTHTSLALLEGILAHLVTKVTKGQMKIIYMFPHAFCDLEKILGLDGKAPRSRRCKWIS